MGSENIRVVSLTVEEFTRPPSYCPFCGEEVWGEGWNPKTGVRYYSHTKTVKRCGDEIALQGPAKAGRTMIPSQPASHSASNSASQTPSPTAAPSGAAPAWISVKDRLPDVGFHVLIYGTFHTQTVGYLRANVSHGMETKGRYWHVAHNTQKGCNWPFDGVTHWMPLPEPPKVNQ